MPRVFRLLFIVLFVITLLASIGVAVVTGGRSSSLTVAVLAILGVGLFWVGTQQQPPWRR